MGLSRAGIFDTMAAAQLVGIGRFGLADLLEQFLGISVPKKGQKSDWSRRPLEAYQMQYAVADTACLATLADRLRISPPARSSRMARPILRKCHRLRPPAQGRAPQRCLANHRFQSPGAPRSGLHPSPVALREKQARSADQPPFKILGNDPLLHLALSAAKHPHTPVENLMRLPRNCVSQRLSQLQQAVDQAADLAQSDWPKPFRPEFGPQPSYSKDAFEALRREVSSIADQLGLTPSLLAPRAAMINLVLKKPKTNEEIVSAGPLLPWQAELILPAITKTLPNP